jgi:phytoene dehydrogenase-like protein
VPSYFNGDISELIINRIELFAPGFKKIILSKIIHTPADYEKYNPNYIGGDINGGSQIWSQIFTRPVLSLTPYRTSSREIYICSASTPPGGGVHGMCGFHAAETVLRDIFPSVI